MTISERLSVSCASFVETWRNSKHADKDVVDELLEQRHRAEEFEQRNADTLARALGSLEVLDRAIVLGVNPMANAEMVIEAVEKVSDWEGQFAVMKHIVKRDPEMVQGKTP
jgi:hypothetical protein